MAVQDGRRQHRTRRWALRWPSVALRRVLLIVASAVVALLAVNACSAAAKSATSPASRGTQAGGMVSMPSESTTTIHIDGFRYRTPVSLPPGARVEVMNMADQSHTVTADAGGFDVPVPAGATMSFTAPVKPGSYPFHCELHANMHGVLVVR